MGLGLGRPRPSWLVGALVGVVAAGRPDIASGRRQRTPQRVLDLRVDAAQVVRRPPGDRLVHVLVEPQEQLLALGHGP